MDDLYEIYRPVWNSKDEHFSVKHNLTRNQGCSTKRFYKKKYGSQQAAYEAACAFFQQVFGFHPACHIADEEITDAVFDYNWTQI